MSQKFLQELQVGLKTLKHFFVLHSITCKSVHLSHTTPFAQGLKGTIKPALKVT